MIEEPGDAADSLSRVFVVAFIVLIAVLAGRLDAGHAAGLDALLAEAAANSQATADSPSSHIAFGPVVHLSP